MHEYDDGSKLLMGTCLNDARQPRWKCLRQSLDVHDTKVCSWHLVFCSTLQPFVHEGGIDGLSQIQIRGLVMTEAASISFCRFVLVLLPEHWCWRCWRWYEDENELLALAPVEIVPILAVPLILVPLILLDTGAATWFGEVWLLEILRLRWRSLLLRGITLLRLRWRRGTDG